MKLWSADEKCVISYSGFTDTAENSAEQLGILTYDSSQMDQQKNKLGILHTFPIPNPKTFLNTFHIPPCLTQHALPMFSIWETMFYCGSKG